MKPYKQLMEVLGLNQEIRGVDMYQGLANVAGDKDTYRMVLDIYVEECVEKIPQLLESSDKDMKLFAIHAHAFKSASNNIGAVDLGEKARLLEMAGKEENRTYINENIDSFVTELKEVIQSVKEYLAN